MFNLFHIKDNMENQISMAYGEIFSFSQWEGKDLQSLATSDPNLLPQRQKGIMTWTHT